MPRQPGRNEPCPCGSGRKYKLCCLKTADAGEDQRRALRRAEGRILEALFPYSLDRFGPAFFQHAWSDFFLGGPPDDVEQVTDVPEFETMFVPWFLLDFVRDEHDEVAEPHWPDQPVGLHWLETEQPALTATERAWLVAACASPMSPFLVEAVERGASLDVRDLLTDRRFHVLEQGASQTIQPGHVFFTRVVTVGGTSVMFGAAPISLPPDRRIRILDWRDRTFRRRKITRRDVAEFDIEIRDLYLQLADEVYDPVPPALQNTDGEELEPTTLVYELSVDVAAALERLTPLATLGGDEHIDDVVRDETGTIVSATLSWLRAGNARRKDWNNTVLGTLRLEPGRLTAEVNSAQRADRLMLEVAERLGERTTLASRTTLDVYEALAERAAARAAGELTDDEEAAAPRPPEVQAVEDDLYRQHAMAWLDEEVPALGGRTPRQAARSKGGRERLEALLAGFAEMPDASRPARREALADMRRELGLDKG